MRLGLLTGLGENKDACERLRHGPGQRACPGVCISVQPASRSSDARSPLTPPAILFAEAPAKKPKGGKKKSTPLASNGANDDWLMLPPGASL